MKDLSLLDVVALTKDLPENNLSRGQVGTIVEMLAPDVYEIEFSDDNGEPYCFQALAANQLMLLHYNYLKAA